MDLRHTHSRKQGDIGEAVAVSWLAQAGYGVWIPFGHSPDCDLIAQRGNRLLRVQVKTSTVFRKGRFNVAVSTRGGNQSWSGQVKQLDPARYDFLFVLVGDGRMWFIPASEVGGGSGILLGGPKYASYEVRMPTGKGMMRPELHLVT